MSERRLARLNEQIKREISELLRTEVRDPRVGLPTVTKVAVTADLWLARVYVRPGLDSSETAKGEWLEGLETAAPFIRRALGKTLKLRRVPELRFIPDRSLEEALRIESVIRAVSSARGAEADCDTDDSGPEVRGASGEEDSTA